MSLSNFFKATSIAVIGASANPKKIGHQIVRNILLAKYPGKLYPINLTEKRIANLKAYSSLDLVPEKNKDKLLVILAIPAVFVNQELIKIAKLGVKNVVVISAGFKEAGREGVEREQGLVAIAKQYKLNLLGPNCLGFINNINKFNASFSANELTPSGLALLSQSGAIGSAILDYLKEKHLGLSYFLSLGNKAVLDETSFIKYLQTDAKISTVVLYLEDISKGKEFVKEASKLAKTKNIFVLLAGQSQSGETLAKTHTGALAKDVDVVKASLKRAGVTVVADLRELFSILKLFRPVFENSQLSNRISIITNAGGVAVLAADALDRHGFKLASSQDLLGDACPKDYVRAMKKEISKGQDSTLFILLTAQSLTKATEVAQEIVALSRSYPKQKIVTCFVGAEAVSEAKKYLCENGIAVFNYPESALEALALLRSHQQLKLGLTEFRPKASQQEPKVEALEQLDYLQSFKLLEKYGLPVAKGKKYQAKLKGLKYPLVLKASGPDFNHKSDQGGVVLNLTNPKELKQAVGKIEKLKQKSFLNPKNYLFVQEQTDPGLELILGLKRDKNFGLTLMLGLGGIYTEVFKERGIFLAEANSKYIRKFVQSLSFYPILAGARKQEYCLDCLYRIINGLIKLGQENEEIVELDINPLILHAKSAQVVDVRIFI